MAWESRATPCREELIESSDSWLQPPTAQARPTAAQRLPPGPVIVGARWGCFRWSGMIVQFLETQGELLEHTPPGGRLPPLGRLRNRSMHGDATTPWFLPADSSAMLPRAQSVPQPHQAPRRRRESAVFYAAEAAGMDAWLPSTEGAGSPVRVPGGPREAAREGGSAAPWSSWAADDRPHQAALLWRELAEPSVVAAERALPDADEAPHDHDEPRLASRALDEPEADACALPGAGRPWVDAALLDDWAAAAAGSRGGPAAALRGRLADEAGSTADDDDTAEDGSAESVGCWANGQHSSVEAALAAAASLELYRITEEMEGSACGRSSFDSVRSLSIRGLHAASSARAAELEEACRAAGGGRGGTTGRRSSVELAAMRWQEEEKLTLSPGRKPLVRHRSAPLSTAAAVEVLF